MKMALGFYWIQICLYNTAVVLWIPIMGLAQNIN